MDSKNISIKGDQAATLGALLAGLDLFAGYPITPSTGALELAARIYHKQFGDLDILKERISHDFEFMQAGSELEAISALFGAGATGKRVMTATSGCGFSLMQEGISYMVGAEIPCVFVNVMRSGPGLGGIYGEQADYKLMKAAGHGDTHAVILAPSTVEEVVMLSHGAFDLAEKYRIPVIVAYDGFLAQSKETVRLENILSLSPEEHGKEWAVFNSDDGNRVVISSKAPPPEGTGSPYRDAIMAHRLKLLDKYSRIGREVADSEEYRTDDADIVFVAYGSAARTAKVAADQLRKHGVKAGVFRPVTLWPFPEKEIAELSKGSEICVLEYNATGQMLEDVERAIQRPAHFIGKGGGNEFYVNEDIADRVLSQMKIEPRSYEIMPKSGLLRDIAGTEGIRWEWVEEAARQSEPPCGEPMEEFPRKYSPDKKSMHYCKGCTHIIVNDQLQDVLTELKSEISPAAIVSGVGCSVFNYMYLNYDSISTAHGRTVAAAAGAKLTNKEKIVLAMGGDGDIASIGIEHLVQAAQRGDNISIILLNNGLYGMTGGQRSALTPEGVKTTTSPSGNPGQSLDVYRLLENFDGLAYYNRVKYTDKEGIKAGLRDIIKGQHESEYGLRILEVQELCPTRQRPFPEWKGAMDNISYGLLTK